MVLSRVHSPPRRGGVAPSASPTRRSLNRSSVEMFSRSDHSVCAFGAATPPLRGGEYCGFMLFFIFEDLPFNPNRIRDERSRRVVDRFCARDRDGLTQHGFQTIHSSLLRVYFDGENGMTVIIACLANGLISGSSHEIRTVIEVS